MIFFWVLPRSWALLFHCFTSPIKLNSISAKAKRDPQIPKGVKPIHFLIGIWTRVCESLLSKIEFLTMAKGGRPFCRVVLL